MGKVLPEFLSKWTTERVREEGVNVIPNTEVQQAEYTNNQVKLTLRNGQTVVCDHVVVAVGSQPNTNLGKESGLEIEASHGGYLVNAELAARNNLYVVSGTFYLLMGFFASWGWDLGCYTEWTRRLKVLTYGTDPNQTEVSTLWLKVNLIQV